MLWLVAELFDGNAGFHSVKQELNTTTPHGRSFVTQLAAFSELEREMIADRTRDAHAACRQKGRRMGQVPYGYRVGADGKTLEEVPQQMRVVLRILREREASRSYYAIAHDLNAEGFTTGRGGKWYPQSVKSILTRKYDGRQNEA